MSLQLDPRFRVVALATVAASALAVAGCTSSRVTGIQAHPTAPMLHVESELYQGKSKLGTELWTCVDQGTQIVCKPECGPRLELACPYHSITKLAD